MVLKKNGLDITKKTLKKIKQYDEQEKRYNSVKKESDPDYDYVRGFDLKYNNALSVKEVDRIIKKLDKNPSTDVLSELKTSHAYKAGKKFIASTAEVFVKDAVSKALPLAATIAVPALTYKVMKKKNLI